MHLRVASKNAVLAQLQERLRIAPEDTAGMGDDLPDLGLRARCGFFAAPANARREVRDRADLVTESSGGRGALRDFAELILRAKGRWQAIVDAAQR